VTIRHRALLAAACLISGMAAAQERPSIGFNRWQEDWSVLADPRLRTEPFDSLKYIPLGEDGYLSFGLNLRERYEANDAPKFGTSGSRDQHYLLQRAQIHADLRPDQHWQVFVQLEDDVQAGKKPVTPVDENPVNVRQGFVTYNTDLAGGEFKLRLGRQEMAFDLQRFVSVRDGPNVRQAYDAAWTNWTNEDWRLIGFWSRPVQYRDTQPFDDISNSHLRYGGLRVERKDVGPGELSLYWSRYDLDGAKFLDAVGNERRDNFDIRYAGKASGFDWDVEEMTQTGHVGTSSILAWAVGSRSGYTLASTPWTPRLGLQADAASGDGKPKDGHLGTFNPLFPNGYYVTLSGYTGYTNFIHLKPSITVTPDKSVTLLASTGLLWRETTADAVYVQPNIPIAHTAGHGDMWTGFYEQLRVDWAVTRNVATALEAVHFQVGESVRAAGGHDSDYLGVEIRFGW